MHKREPCLLPLLLFFTISLAASSLRSDDGGSVVRLPQGNLRGTQETGGMRVFKGVPYAAPPVGPLRWRPPQPAASWSGVRDAAHAGPACMQPLSYARIAPSSMSEDCLYLNIWAPVQQPGGHLPVLVWIHGGGFVVGSGSGKEDDGENLARKGLVVVTLNYRLGVFGFLAHPDLTRESPHQSSGNYGLLDQLAALRWVKNNATSFGGDPKNVTVAGESAGAASIGFLLTSPLANGLFQRAIVESPASLFLPAPELEKSYRNFLPAEEIGRDIDSSIVTMRSWPATKVMQRAEAVTEKLISPRAAVPGTSGRGTNLPDLEKQLQPWWPFVDGWVVPRQLALTYARNAAITVPLLVGTNADEGSIFVMHFPYRSEQAYRGYLERNFAPCAHAMFRLYPASDPAKIHAQAERIQTDALFLYGARSLASAERRRERDVFVYRFTRIGPDERLAKLGAWHGSELAYVFGHTAQSSPRMFNAQDQAISRTMMRAWVRFAAVGNPNIDGLPQWPAWNDARGPYMDFGNSSGVRTIANTSQFRIFKHVFSPEGTR